MNSSKRREQKKKRREKRLAKRIERFDEVGAVFVELLDELTTQRGPFPGAYDPTTSRPDMTKFELSTWIDVNARGSRQQFEKDLQQGLLHFFPQIDHWAMEEYLYHGSPYSTGNPIDAFFAANPHAYPPKAVEQFRQWKQARLGVYEIGSCAGDLVEFRERDPIDLRPIGEWTQAICLAMNGVDGYRSQKGNIAITYLAPWAPDQGIHCAMGYGLCLKASECASAAPLILGMRNVKSIAFPLPWRRGKRAHAEFLQEWMQRDWFLWMTKHVSCPFQAIVPLAENLRIVTIDMMMTRSSEEAQRMGIYFAGLVAEKEVGLLGATALTPLDFDSPNAMAFAEYAAYRDAVGPPPATRGW